MTPPTAQDFEQANAALARFLVAERQSHAKTREQLDDLTKFVGTLFDADRDNLLANASVTLREDNGTQRTLSEVVEQREQARRIAAHLEAENARLIQTVEDVKLYAKELLGNWGADGYANDILAILHGERKAVEE